MNKKVKGSASSFPVGVLLGVSISVAIAVTLIVVLTGAVLNERIKEVTAGYFLLGVEFIAAIIGAMVAIKKIKRRKALVCVSTVTAFFLVQILGNVMLFGGQFEGVGTTALVLLSAVVLVMLIGGGGLRKEKKRSGKYRFC